MAAAVGATNPPMDPFEKVIRPIVEGQIRSFTHDHPEVLEAVNWYRSRKGPEGKRITLVNSMAKRIVCDLMCPSNRKRIEEALRASTSAQDEDGVARATAPSEGESGPGDC